MDAAIRVSNGRHARTMIGSVVNSRRIRHMGRWFRVAMVRIAVLSVRDLGDLVIDEGVYCLLSVMVLWVLTFGC